MYFVPALLKVFLMIISVSFSAKFFRKLFSFNFGDKIVHSATRYPAKLR